MIRIVLLGLVVAGCTFSNSNVIPPMVNVDEPEIGVVVTAQAGSTMLRTSRTPAYEAYELLSPYTHKFIAFNVRLLPGIYTRSRRIGYTDHYRAIGDTVQSCTRLGCRNVPGGFMIDERNGDLRVFRSHYAPFETEGALELRAITYLSVDEVSYRQELIYIGRAGDAIRLEYREFDGDLNNPISVQQLTFDMSDDNTIGFQNVRIEVVDTSGFEISYRVLRSFVD